MSYYGAGLQLTIIQKRQQADVKVGHLRKSRSITMELGCRARI